MGIRNAFNKKPRRTSTSGARRGSGHPQDKGAPGSGLATRRPAPAGKTKRKRSKATGPQAPLHDRRRRLVAARETTLRDLGGLMLEMYKRNRFREELLLDKCEEVLAVEVEIAHIDQRLFQLAPPNAAGMRPIGRCECGSPIYPGQNFCGVCGRSFATLTMHRTCERCGGGLRPGDSFCATCGAEAPDSFTVIEAAQPPSRSQQVGRANAAGGATPDIEAEPQVGPAPAAASAPATPPIDDTVVLPPVEPPTPTAPPPPGAAGGHEEPRAAQQGPASTAHATDGESETAIDAAVSALPLPFSLPPTSYPAAESGASEPHQPPPHAPSAADVFASAGAPTVSPAGGWETRQPTDMPVDPDQPGRAPARPELSPRQQKKLARMRAKEREKIARERRKQAIQRAKAKRKAERKGRGGDA